MVGDAVRAYSPARKSVMARRRLARGAERRGTASVPASGRRFRQATFEKVHILDVITEPIQPKRPARPTGLRALSAIPAKPRRRHLVVLGRISPIAKSPADAIAKAIRDALDPRLAPAPVRRMADMSPEEVAAIARRVGARPPGR